MFTTLRPAFERILIGVDDSQHAAWAAGVAGKLAGQLPARVMLVHVVEVDVPVDGDVMALERVEELRRQFGLELLERTRLSLPKCVDTECSQRVGVPSEEISAAAREWRADLIVIGTSGRGRLAHFVLGSTADAVIRQSPCPVISVAHEPKCISRQPADRARAGADRLEPVSAHVQS